jgi:hypothetical protein
VSWKILRGDPKIFDAAKKGGYVLRVLEPGAGKEATPRRHVCRRIRSPITLDRVLDGLPPNEYRVQIIGPDRMTIGSVTVRTTA